MNKVIYIKPDEEITSVIDRLVKTKDKEVFLVVPSAAVLGQSAVNLKLLKREAGNLAKTIKIVSSDPILQRLAKKNDFVVSDSLPAETQNDDRAEVLGAQKNPEEPTLDEQIPESRFEDLLAKEKRPLPLRIADIVRGGAAPKGKLVINKFQESRDLKSQELNKVKETELPPVDESELDRGQAEPELSAGDAILGKEEKDFSGHRYDFLRPREEKTSAGASAAENERLAGSNRLTIFSFPGKIFALFVASALVIAALVSFLILPKAEVLISAKKEKLSLDVKVAVDRNLADVSLDGKKIPGQLLKLEDKITQEFPATGQRQLNEKANGVITVYNVYSSSPQTLVETTRFLSSQGLIFRLTKTVTIPGAKIDEGRIIPNFLDVAVEADQPGGEYNIGPATFSIPGFKSSPKYDGFYGKSKEPMSGGSTENVRVLTQEDFDKAKQQAWEGLKEKMDAQIKTQIPENFTLLKDAVSLELGQAQTSVKVGQAAEKFNVSVKGIAKAIIFSQDNILLLLKKELISGGGQKDFSDRHSFAYENVSADFEKGSVSFRLKGEQEIFWIVKADEIKALIAGKREKEVNELFSRRPEIAQARFSFWPFWVKKIPAQKEKIEISIDPVRGSADIESN